MDAITPYASGVIPKCEPVGCSSICVNNEEEVSYFPMRNHYINMHNACKF